MNTSLVPPALAGQSKLFSAPCQVLENYNMKKKTFGSRTELLHSKTTITFAAKKGHTEKYIVNLITHGWLIMILYCTFFHLFGGGKLHVVYLQPCNLDQEKNPLKQCCLRLHQMSYCR